LGGRYVKTGKIQRHDEGNEFKGVIEMLRIMDLVVFFGNVFLVSVVITSEMKKEEGGVGMASNQWS
jgi:hypothetical protein